MNISYRALWIIIVLLTAIATSPITGKTPKPTPKANQSHTPGLALTNVKNGDTLSGEAELKVHVPNRGREGEALTISVDGKPGEFHTYQAKQTSHGFIAVLSLQTDAYSNGWHRLVIRSSDQRQLQSHVKFVNDISQISLDDVANPTAHIIAKNKTNKHWTVMILTTAVPASTVRAFHGYGKTISIHWDGKDAHGKSVPDDSYTVAIIAGKAQPHLNSIFKNSASLASP